jgi:hypothetical protein
VGWNFALNRQVGDELFHPSSLSNFRQRLLDHELSATGFQAVLDGLVEAGLVARQSRQRLDSTQIFGHLSRMSRLECVRETLRLALEELARSVSPEARPPFWPALWERYVESDVDFRASASVLQQKMQQAGADALQVLQWAQPAEGARREGEPVQLLQRVWNENFELQEGGAFLQRDSQPPGAVHNPHDPEAQWAAKGQGKHKKEHVGYKVQVAETVQEGSLQAGEPTPHFITAMVTQPAIGSDDAGLPLVEAQLQAMGLEQPGVWYVDGAYVSAERLAQAQQEGRQIIGPAQGAPKKEGRFSAEDFAIQVEERRAICPAGKANTQCSRLEEEATGKVLYRFEWSTACAECPLRGQCLGKDQRHRTLTVGQYHTVLQQRRREQRTEAFQQQAKHRNAIEGTQSELVRGHGLRRARYRGLKKVALQNYLIGAACNIKRWIRRRIWLIEQAALAVSATQAAAATC